MLVSASLTVKSVFTFDAKKLIYENCSDIMLVNTYFRPSTIMFINE